MFRKDPNPFHEQLDSISNLTQSMKEFLQALFIVDPYDRATAHAANQLAWLRNNSEIKPILAPRVSTLSRDVTQNPDDPQITPTFVDRMQDLGVSQDDKVPDYFPFNRNLHDPQQRNVSIKSFTQQEEGGKITRSQSTQSDLGVTGVLSTSIATMTSDTKSRSCLLNSVPKLESGLGIHTEGGPQQRTGTVSEFSHAATYHLQAIVSRRERYTESDDKALLHFVRHGDVEVTELLLNNGADADTINSRDQTPLYIASKYGHTAIVQLLIDRIASPFEPNVRGYTPLYAATRYGHKSVVQVLLDRSVDISVPSEHGRTPLHTAIRYGFVEIVQLLLENGADISTLTRNGRTPLHIAIRNGHENIVQLLFDRGADIDISDRNGETPLHAAAHSDHVRIVRMLLHRGASPSVVRNDGATPLDVAASRGNFRVVGVLVRQHLNPNAISENVLTPLQIAARDGRSQMVKIFLDNGADPRLKPDGSLSAATYAKERGYITMHQILETKTRELEHMKTERGATR